MFTTLQVSLEVVRQLRTVVTEMKRRDAGLADQLVRAASSVTLNLAEGAKRNGRDQLHHYRIADGSAAEVRAALEVASAWAYVATETASEPRRLIDRLLGLLWGLTHPRR